MADDRPADDELFDALRRWSKRTRGRRAARLKVWFDDDSKTIIHVPAYDKPLIVVEEPPDEEEHEDEPETWPPASGWAFRPGVFAFNGEVHKLRGRLWGILRVMAEHAGRSITISNLAEEVWGDDQVEDHNVRNHISLLRNRLVSILGLENSPIAESEDSSYKLVLY